MSAPQLPAPTGGAFDLPPPTGETYDLPAPAGEKAEPRSRRFLLTDALCLLCGVCYANASTGGHAQTRLRSP